MKNGIMKIVMIAMVAMMATGSLAYAKGGGKGHGGKGHGEKIQKIMKKLDLSAEQKTRIKEIRDGFKTANAGTIEQIKSLHTQIKTARKNKDQAEVTALREQLKAKMESLRPARERMIEQIKAVLTAEQRAELEKMMAKHKEKGSKGRNGKAGKGDKADKAGRGAKQQGEAAID